jgi:SAM-dependent methyltransferase
MQSRGGRYGEQVFVCANGFRHYVPSVERLEAYGLKWPSDLKQVPDEVLGSYRIGGWLPHVFTERDPNQINDSRLMREYLGANLSGIGLEVGAGASPFPVPLTCTVLYGDRIAHEQLVAELYPGQREFELVRPDFLTDFGSFGGVASESVDFVIGCHVIEHVFDPIGSLVNAYRVLKPGGTLLLVVPDKNRTFDRERPVTALEHLILDHTAPSVDRDREHYEEFYTLAFKTERERLADKVDAEFGRRGDLHVHVWDYPAFGELVKWVQENRVRWQSIKSYPARPDEASDIEFYFVLRK